MTNTTDKASLVNSIAIMLSCVQQAPALQKLTIPTLDAMYRGLLRNANAWALVQEEAKEAKNKAFILENRNKALEAEIRKLRKKLAGQK